MFYDNLLAACEKKGVRITPLVAECGGAKGSISNWKKGASPNSDIVLKLAVRLNVSTDYLLTGKEKLLDDNLDLDIDQQELMEDYKTLSDIDKARVLERVKTLKELDDKNKVEAARRQKYLAATPIKKAKPKATKLPEPEPINESEEDDETEYLYMPFFDLPVSAGTGVYLDSEDAKKIRVPADDETRKSDYVLRVSGDSMEPRYYDGDLVLVKQQQHIEEGEVGIFLYNGEGYIKIFGGDRLISLNPNYKDKIISENDQFLCLGKVMGILSIQHKFR